MWPRRSERAAIIRTALGRATELAAPRPFSGRRPPVRRLAGLGPRSGPRPPAPTRSTPTREHVTSDCPRSRPRHLQIEAHHGGQKPRSGTAPSWRGGGAASPPPATSASATRRAPLARAQATPDSALPRRGTPGRWASERLPSSLSPSRRRTDFPRHPGVVPATTPGHSRDQRRVAGRCQASSRRTAGSQDSGRAAPIVQPERRSGRPRGALDAQTRARLKRPSFA